MSLPTFEGDYKPRLKRTLDRNVVDYMEKKVNEAKQLNDADRAERLLDEACDECVNQVTSQINEIKKEVRDRRSTAREADYTRFVEGVTEGIRQSQGLIKQIFDRIRSLIRIIVDWIRKGISWIWGTVQDAFNAIRNFFT